MLFDQFEKNLYAQPGSIQLSNCYGRQGELISQKDERSAFLIIEILDPAQLFRIISFAIITRQDNYLVEYDTGALIDLL